MYFLKKNMKRKRGLQTFLFFDNVLKQPAVIEEISDICIDLDREQDTDKKDQIALGIVYDFFHGQCHKYTIPLTIDSNNILFKYFTNTCCRIIRTPRYPTGELLYALKMFYDYGIQKQFDWPIFDTAISNAIVDTRNAFYESLYEIRIVFQRLGVTRYIFHTWLKFYIKRNYCQMFFARISMVEHVVAKQRTNRYQHFIF